MRWILPIALAALLCQGCFVFDELDKGQAIMDQHSPTRSKGARAEAARKAEGSPQRTEDEEGILERLQQWWTKVREPAPPQRDASDVVVRCEIKGNTHFTRKSDCRIRGGRAI
jgi:hypothetical protein